MIEPRSAYIHVPFCSHRCGYCNFTLVTGRDDLIRPFLEALELELKSVLCVPRQVETIFFGGGTPSYLAVADLEDLLKLVNHWLIPRANAEISVELNPVHGDPDRLRVLRDLGVNRISLGGQSFSNRKLQLLERDHDSEQLHRALVGCGEVFENVSLDLIFAAPKETLAEWQADIGLALASPIRHLSTYGLTVERGSAFYGRSLRGQITEVDADTQLSMYEHAIDASTGQRWEHYEVLELSGRPGYRCRHNENYWLGEAWWAFGPGAASFIPQDDGTYARNVNHRSTTAYIKRLLAGRTPVAEHDVVSPEQLIRERLVFGLRRLEGVCLDELSCRWGSPVRDLFEPYLTDYMEKGWLTIESAGRLKLTRAGLVISDSLWPELLA